MPNMQKITLMGHLGKDAVINTTTTGKESLQFSLAVTDQYKDKKTTTWYRVSSFRQGAEKILPWLTKGKAVYVSGKLSIKLSEANGKTYLNCDVMADDICFLSGKEDSQKQETQQEQHAQTEENPHGYDGQDVPF